ncbi:hypothetical protein [Nostoc sp.]
MIILKRERSLNKTVGIWAAIVLKPNKTTGQTMVAAIKIFTWR